jgi:hypothetical protein
MIHVGWTFRAVKTLSLLDGLGKAFGKILRRAGSRMIHEGCTHAFHFLCAVVFLQGLNQNIGNGL